MKSPLFDSLKSLIGGLGDPSRDKSAGTTFTEIPIGDDELQAAYSSNWIARKIVDIPAKDALRKWRLWSGDSREVMEAEEKRLKVKLKILDALTKARLYGGAAVYIGTDQEPSEPLSIDSIGIGGIKYLTVFTRRELQANELSQDPMSHGYAEPISYTVGTGVAQATIHPSRLVLFKGDKHGDVWLSAGINQGWGESVLKAVSKTVKESTSTNANVSSLIFEANIDVIAVPNLGNKCGDPSYRKAMLERFALAATGKGINGMLLLDKEEEYSRRQAQFAHLKELMDAFAGFCAGAADIPMTRFLGQSPGGLQATGDADMENYHDRLQSMQELEIEPAMANLDACLVRSAGAASDSEYKWLPFSQMSEKELSEIGKNIAETLSKLDGLRILTGDEMRTLASHRLTESKAFPDMASLIEETAGRLELDDPDDIEAA